MGSADSSITKGVRVAVIVAALGYFVDIYDLVLFTIVRVPSLTALGLTGDALRDYGIFLLNMQMVGMLVGGIIWGILGDKRGRVSVLFGSIILYSVANIANAFVGSVEAYAVMRVIAGIGLAGELGAGITLVSEMMHKDKRGYGTTIVASIGILGAVAASLVGSETGWRTAFIVGGVLGLLLLFMRIGAYESGMYKEVKERAHVRRGDFRQLFANRTLLMKYLNSILIGLPLWYIVGVLVSLSKELGEALGVHPAPSPGKAIMYCYMGLAVGDLASGLLSQYLKSRKRVALIFILFCICTATLYFTAQGVSLTTFYAICVILGLSGGYWAIFVTMASEQFGTNIRATVTTTVPNFVRGAVVPMTLLFRWGIDRVGILQSGAIVGAAVIIIALIALYNLDETYSKDLDYLE
ncbi:MAG: MFS transporter [Candidatus Kapaibacterium sp.]